MDMGLNLKWLGGLKYGAYALILLQLISGVLIGFAHWQTDGNIKPLADATAGVIVANGVNADLAMDILLEPEKLGLIDVQNSHPLFWAKVQKNALDLLGFSIVLFLMVFYVLYRILHKLMGLSAQDPIIWGGVIPVGVLLLLFFAEFAYVVWSTGNLTYIPFMWMLRLIFSMPELIMLKLGGSISDPLSVSALNETLTVVAQNVTGV